MLRYFFTQEDLDQIFTPLKHTYGSWSKLAKDYGISTRSLQDWRNSRTALPENFIKSVSTKLPFSLPRPARKIDESKIKSTNGKIGGLTRQALYGNPGTADGRRLGGIRSSETMRAQGVTFFSPLAIKEPDHSVRLAELIGIILGDGGMTRRQIVITLHKIDDEQYSKYVADLIKKVFDIKPSLVYRKNTNVIDVIVSRTLAVNYLCKMGLSPGSKVREQVKVPSWISKSDNYRKACLRGLFDTDGCFYVDRHFIKNKLYFHSGMNFTNRSLPILGFFKESLEHLGFHPTQKTRFAIFWRREKEIKRYLDKIGSSNPKIWNRYRKFMEGYRSGYNGTDSKSVGGVSPTRVRISPLPPKFGIRK